MNYSILKSVSIITALVSLFSASGVWPFQSDSFNHPSKNSVYHLSANTNEADSLLAYHQLWDTIASQAPELDSQVFAMAYAGHQALAAQNQVDSTANLSIVDFTKSSKSKRLFIIDFVHRKVAKQTWVAHGRGSGLEYAKAFSNRPESHQSSLGFYITGGTYHGSNGYSLKLKGVEPGINDKAEERAIVMHGANYVHPSLLKSKGFMGRSWGCPAVTQKEHREIINTIKNGNVLFIYYPSTAYLKKSNLLRDILS